MDQSPDLEDVIGGAIDRALVGLHTFQPGIIMSFDRARQVADVQPALMDVYVNEVGNRVAGPLPLLTSVPVVHLGGGGFSAKFPVKAGDTCALIFASGSLDRWLGRGGVVDPEAPDRHQLGDAIALVGIRHFQNPLTPTPDNVATIGNENGTVIAFDTGEIRLGGNNATQRVALESDLNTLVQAVHAAADALALAGDPSATAIEALRDTLSDLGFPQCATRVKAI